MIKQEVNKFTTKREEIIGRAYQVFYTQGFHATGVDTVLQNSGISKRTMYKYFRNKEALIAAVVEYYQQLAFERIPAIMASRTSDPIRQILCLFDIKGEEFSEGNFTGCFALNAKLEFESKDAGIEAACSHFYMLLEEYIATLCAYANCKNPKMTARKVILLFKGAVVMGQMHHDPAAAQLARSMAKDVLEGDR